MMHIADVPPHVGLSAKIGIAEWAKEMPFIVRMHLLHMSADVFQA